MMQSRMLYPAFTYLCWPRRWHQSFMGWLYLLAHLLRLLCHLRCCCIVVFLEAVCLNTRGSITHFCCSHSTWLACPVTLSPALMCSEVLFPRGLPHVLCALRVGFI